MAAGLLKLVTAAPAVLIFGLVGGASTYAQVATDGTVGPRGQLGGPDYNIADELGRRAGRNLFHSFERFDLRTLDDGTIESATFSGPDAIRNVISRVTGGERSDINGAIRSTINGADFFFLNPAGVMFGPNASLDLQGSFHVSTADELRFADGAKFNASDPTASSFTVAAPEAFGFLNAHTPAPISVDRSTLAVPTGEAFSIVGGDINVAGDIDFAGEVLIFKGSIEAEAGTITLAAVGGPGEVQLGTGAVAALRRANIRLNRVFVGTSSPDDVADVTPRGGGGSVTIRADRLLVISSNVATSTGSRGESGSLNIGVGRLIVEDASVSADTLGSGDAGEVRVEARELVRCILCTISSSTGASGRGGTVTIETNKLEITADGEIQASTFGSGDGGQVLIRAAELMINFGSIGSGVFPEEDPREATGNAGAVIVEAGNLTLRNGFIAALSYGAGDAGAVTVTADRLNLLAGGQISSAMQGDGTGRGGDVVVTAREGLVISGRSTIFRDFRNQPLPSGIFAASEPDNAGRGGTVTITAPVITIADGAEISAASFGTDQAGSVTINAERLRLNNAKISTESKTGGGRVAIDGGTLTDLRDSQISTTIGQAGGSLSIEADILVLDGSDILLSSDQPAFLPTVAHLIRSPDSRIILNSAPFDTGEVQGIRVEAASAAIVIAPPLRERCGARRDIGTSSFTGVGRGGLPPSPDGPLASAYVVDEAAVAEAQKAGSRRTAGIAPTNVRLVGLSAPPCVPLD